MTATIRKETLLVTGGAGFIGGNFVLDRVLDRNTQIINLDALTYAGNTETLRPLDGNDRHIFVHGSIADGALIGDLLNKFRPAAVLNFAAETHVDRSIDGPEAFIQTNLVGTFQLLESVRRYWEKLPGDPQEDFRFLHVSTDEVYGSLGETGQFTETTQYQPNSPYSASKAGSDHLVRAYHHTYGLPVLTTNCSNNYGPYQFPEKLIPLMIMNALERKPLPVYGAGANIRDWLYVLDHCSAINRVLEAGIPGEVYNVGGNNEKTNLEVVNTLCDLLDQAMPGTGSAPHRELIQFVDDRPGHDFRYSIDSTRLKTELGWVPRETFETGMAKTVEWYLANRSWCENILDGSYRGERLGLSMGTG